MRLMGTLFIAALFSFVASNSQACAVDSVSAKTDTTISISWNLTSCNRLSAGHTFEICWKKKSNSGNACISPIYGDNETGTATISGLSPSEPYRIRTRFHKRGGWHHVTTRIVTTDPSPISTETVLRYVKGTGQKYSVVFYWKNPPGGALRLAFYRMVLGHLQPIINPASVSLNGTVMDPLTHEYSTTVRGFSENQKYYAAIIKDPTADLVSNYVNWK